MGWTDPTFWRLSLPKTNLATQQNHRQEHDPENQQLQEPCRIRLVSGHGYDPLFSGAFSGGQYLPTNHGFAVAVCLPGPEVLVHLVPVLDPVHWLFHCALLLVHFSA